jgi:hypothetical protein
MQGVRQGPDMTPIVQAMGEHATRLGEVVTAMEEGRLHTERDIRALRTELERQQLAQNALIASLNSAASELRRGGGPSVASHVPPVTAPSQAEDEIREFCFNIANYRTRYGKDPDAGTVTQWLEKLETTMKKLSEKVVLGQSPLEERRIQWVSECQLTRAQENYLRNWPLSAECMQHYRNLRVFVPGYDASGILMEQMSSMELGEAILRQQEALYKTTMGEIIDSLKESGEKVGQEEVDALWAQHPHAMSFKQYHKVNPTQSKVEILKGRAYPNILYGWINIFKTTDVAILKRAILGENVNLYWLAECLGEGALKLTGKQGAPLEINRSNDADVVWNSLGVMTQCTIKDQSEAWDFPTSQFVPRGKEALVRGQMALYSFLLSDQSESAFVAWHCISEDEKYIRKGKGTVSDAFRQKVEGKIDAKLCELRKKVLARIDEKAHTQYKNLQELARVIGKPLAVKAPEAHFNITDPNQPMVIS